MKKLNENKIATLNGGSIHVPDCNQMFAEFVAAVGLGVSGLNEAYGITVNMARVGCSMHPYTYL